MIVDGVTSASVLFRGLYNSISVASSGIALQVLLKRILNRQTGCSYCKRLKCLFKSFIGLAYRLYLVPTGKKICWVRRHLFFSFRPSLFIPKIFSRRRYHSILDGKRCEVVRGDDQSANRFSPKRCIRIVLCP